MLLFLKNREVKNAGWMIGGKVMQMLLGLFVGVLTARYLGPSEYGLINYAATYTAFFSSLCSLGINSVIIKDFVDNPGEQGTSIGTTFVLRFISSVLSMVTIFAAVNLIDSGEEITIAVVMLSSLSLLFHIFDTLNCWFHYKYMAKIVAISSCIAYTAVAIYKITLLVLEKDIRWFAFSTSVDYIVIAVVLIIVYFKNGGPRFRFSWSKGKKLLAKSYPYILSGMMVAVYAQTDKIMIKHMMNSADVGYYSTASAICSMWTFVLAAIIDAIFPTIYRVYRTDQDMFERKNRQLYAIVIYLSLAVSVGFIILGEPVIWILYGEEYIPAASSLKIITFGTVFSYLGIARHAWIVCKNMQKHLTTISLFAAIANVMMNCLLIPAIGIDGAALASVMVQFFTCFVVPIFIKGMRPNIRLMVEAFLLKNVFKEK